MLRGEIRLVGPPEFIPGDGTTHGTTVFENLDAAVEGAIAAALEHADADHFPGGNQLYREQRLHARRLLARLHDQIKGLGTHGAHRKTGKLRLGRAQDRDVEIASEVADGPRQVILDQVANGVAVRMALIYLLSGGDPGALSGGEN